MDVQFYLLFTLIYNIFNYYSETSHFAESNGISAFSAIFRNIIWKVCNATALLPDKLEMLTAVWSLTCKEVEPNV